jgi:Uma2 family endonuclease
MGVPKALASAADYLAFERGAVERHQFVDGEIFAMAGESLAHSTITANLIMSLGGQLRGKPCRALSPNMKIRSGPAESRSTKGLFSYADVTVVCGEPRFHDEHRDVLLNPKLIVEVLSPSTELFDRGDKFLRYRTWLDSFTDYLLVSTAAPRVEQFVRDAPNRWVYTTIEGLDNGVELPGIGCRLDLAEIFDRVTFEPWVATE